MDDFDHHLALGRWMCEWLLSPGCSRRELLYVLRRASEAGLGELVVQLLRLYRLKYHARPAASQDAKRPYCRWTEAEKHLAQGLAATGHKPMAIAHALKFSKSPAQVRTWLAQYRRKLTVTHQFAVVRREGFRPESNDQT